MTRNRWGAALILALPCAAYGQDDFRHVDENRPLRVEDAYPIKFLEWEWELGLRGELAEGGDRAGGAVGELKVGVARNMELGVELHGAWARVPGTTTSGLEEIGAHALVNLNQEGKTLPAIGFRGDLVVPGRGALAPNDLGGRLRTMLTRSSGPWRVHLNGAHTWASTADGGRFWSAGAALDRALGLTSRSLLGGVYVETPTAGGDTRWWGEVGTRMQVGVGTVLDIGVASRLDRWGDGAANIEVTVGLSHGFGIPGLVRVPPYPHPRID